MSDWRRGHTSPLTVHVLNLPLSMSAMGMYPFPSCLGFMASRSAQDSFTIRFAGDDFRKNDPLEAIVRTTVPRSPFGHHRWCVRLVVPGGVEGVALANSKRVDEVSRHESLDRALRRAMRELRLADTKRRLGARLSP